MWPGVVDLLLQPSLVGFNTRWVGHVPHGHVFSNPGTVCESGSVGLCGWDVWRLTGECCPTRLFPHRL